MVSLPTLDSRVLDARRRARIGQALGCQVSPRDWVPFPKQARFLACSAFEALFGGAAGPGKGSPLDEIVYTPFGPTTMGELRVGSLVSNPDGTVAKVIQVHELGERDIFKVSFADGASVEVTEDHLWLVHFASKRMKAQRKNADGTDVRGRVATTRALIDYLEKQKGATRPYWPLVPLTEPVEFTRGPGRCADPFPIDPYALGVLLGDGYIARGAVNITSADPFIVRQMRKALPESTIRRDKAKADGNRFAYRVVDRMKTRDILEKLGVYGHLAPTKFVPSTYKLAPIETRRAVLQGLMDTDGTVGTGGDCSFTSTSERLATDVQWIARSLGYKATITSKQPFYRHKETKARVECRTAYTVHLQGRSTEQLFRLPRKRARCRLFNGGVSVASQRMISIEPVGRKVARCITVDHPNGLYVTRDFLVTHNSEVLVIGALRFVDRGDYSALLLRRKAADLDSLIQRAAKYYTQISGVRMRRGGRLWLFPSGARIKLGGAQNERDIENYNSEEYQYVGFDEASHFTLRQWLFMISRLRGPADIPLMLRGATNPGGVGHCVPHGDVLTPIGWRDIRTMRVGDPVFSVRPDGTLFETTVAQVHVSDYEGDIVEVNAGGLRMSCTPNHRVAKVGGRRDGLNTRTRRKDAFSLVSFDELPGQATILRSVGWEGAALPDFELPEVPGRSRNRQPVRLPASLFCELLGWFISEGHVTIRRGGAKSFAISQEKEAGRIAIRRMLDACGFRYAEAGHQFVINSTRWASYLAQFGKCRDKFIPAWVKASAPANLRTLFDALMNGDGHWAKPGKAGHYYTTSARLAEDVAEIAIKLGYCVSTSERQRENRDGLSFDVSVSTKKTGGTEILTGQHRYGVATETHRRSDVRRVHFAGKVYCIGVEGTHSFVIRQRGSVWVSGNSWILNRFAPWLYPPHELEYDGPRAPDGQTCHYLTTEGTDVERVVSPGTPGSRSRAFFHASIADNPVYAGSDYEKNLDALPLLDRLRLKHGNWMARPAAGLFFKRHWFVDGSKGRHLLDHIPGRVAQRIRYWDLAGTEQERAAKGGAWTAGLLYAKLEDGSYVIEHVARGQWSSGEVESQIVSLAETDPDGTDVVIELDPGQAGKFQGNYFMRHPALAGYTVRMARPAGDKLTRARTPSAQSEQGNIRIMRGEWVEPFLREAESFPEGTKDQIDALSGAHRQLALVATSVRTPRGPTPKKGAQAPREGTSARRSGGF